MFSHATVDLDTSKITMSQTDELLNDINKRIGVMISLLLRMVNQEKPAISLKEQVRLLDSLAMRPKDIAMILGRTGSHINKELAVLRKEKVKKHE